MHKRTAIRQAVAAQLVAANTAAGARVYPSRVTPWRRSELPGLSVSTPDEDSEQASLDGGLKRTMRLNVLGLVQDTAGPDDDLDARLDDLAEQVEAAMKADPRFGRIVSNSFLAKTTTELEDENGRPIAGVQLTYRVTYLTQ